MGSNVSAGDLEQHLNNLHNLNRRCNEEEEEEAEDEDY